MCHTVLWTVRVIRLVGIESRRCVTQPESFRKLLARVNTTQKKITRGNACTRCKAKKSKCKIQSVRCNARSSNEWVFRSIVSVPGCQLDMFVAGDGQRPCRSCAKIGVSCDGGGSQPSAFEAPSAAEFFGPFRAQIQQDIQVEQSGLLQLLFTKAMSRALTRMVGCRE